MTDEASIERTVRRFTKAAEHRSTGHYVGGKLRRDPVSRAIVELGYLGDVIDIGCGRGHVAVFLLEMGLARRVRGFDWDEAKIALAQRAADGLDASFESGDVRTITGLEPANTVLLIDVLHYFDHATQDALLDTAAALVRPGGRLVVRDATSGKGWRSHATVFVEWISTGVRLNLGERVSIRNIAGELVPRLEKAGFVCTVEPCWKGTPFSNVLLVAARPPT